MCCERDERGVSLGTERLTDVVSGAIGERTILTKLSIFVFVVWSEIGVEVKYRQRISTNQIQCSPPISNAANPECSPGHA